MIKMLILTKIVVKTVSFFLTEIMRQASFCMFSITTTFTAFLCKATNYFLKNLNQPPVPVMPSTADGFSSKWYLILQLLYFTFSSLEWLIRNLWQFVTDCSVLDHLTSYFNLAKSVTVLQDTSGNPIVVQMLPDAPKLQVQDAAVVALLPKVPLPSAAVGESLQADVLTTHLSRIWTLDLKTFQRSWPILFSFAQDFYSLNCL